MHEKQIKKVEEEPKNAIWDKSKICLRITKTKKKIMG